MSQHRRLLQHVHRLAKFEPRITAEAIDVPSLVAHIRRIFDEHHPAHTRAPPVVSHQHAQHIIHSLSATQEIACPRQLLREHISLCNMPNEYDRVLHMQKKG